MATERQRPCGLQRDPGLEHGSRPPPAPSGQCTVERRGGPLLRNDHFVSCLWMVSCFHQILRRRNGKTSWLSSPPASCRNCFFMKVLVVSCASRLLGLGEPSQAPCIQVSRLLCLVNCREAESGLEEVIWNQTVETTPMTFAPKGLLQGGDDIIFAPRGTSDRQRPRAHRSGLPTSVSRLGDLGQSL